MSTTISKDHMRKAIDALPEGATIEDALDRLYFLSRIERGLAELDAGMGATQDEVRKRFDQWLK